MSARGSWGGVCCSTDKDKAAVRTWFAAFIPEDWGAPLAAQVYETDDGRTPRFRCLFETLSGQYRQATRASTRAGWNITIGRPSPALLAYARVKP